MERTDLDVMVDRFLSWKLPEDFHPDAGISFKPEYNVEYNAKLGIPPARHQPIGTNLLTATQAKAMLEHVAKPALDAKQDLLAALTLLHDNLAEYQRINNIGGYDNHDMKMARAAIAKATA